MSAQDLFFTLGSVYMALGIVFMVVVIGGIFFIYKKATQLERDVKNRIDRELGEMREKPRLLAAFVATMIAKAVKSKFKNDA